jgi:hypothetical protein
MLRMLWLQIRENRAPLRLANRTDMHFADEASRRLGHKGRHGVRDVVGLKGF